MLGTAGLPHILMRFYTVPDAKTARVSVSYATAFIGFFYLLTFILGFGAMVLVGPAERFARSTPAATWRRRCWRRPSAASVSRLHLRRGVRHDSRGRRRADAGRRGDAVARPVGERGAPRRRRRNASSCGWRAARRSCWRCSRSCWASSSRVRTSPTWSGWRLRSPPARISRRWCSRCSGASSRRAARRCSMLVGTASSLMLIYCLADDSDRHAEEPTAWFPLRNPGPRLDPVVVRRRRSWCRWCGRSPRPTRDSPKWSSGFTRPEGCSRKTKNEERKERLVRVVSGFPPSPRLRRISPQLGCIARATAD